jgi:SpoVK/Ycf46/Vps4 family AAA+-type ATPase
MFIFEENGDKVQLVNTDSTDIRKTLENAVYKLEVRSSFFGTSVSFNKTNDYKKGCNIKSGTHGQIKDMIDTFLSDEQNEARNLLGLKHKIGLVMKGKPGTGKTFLAGQIAQKLCDEKNAVAIVGNDFENVNLSSFVDNIRKHDENRLIVLILDEFEKYYRDLNTAKLLSFLDGPESKDNIIIIATVNSTKNLPDTLTERPGRFEKIFDFNSDLKNVVSSLINDMIPSIYKEKLNIEGLSKTAIEKDMVTIDQIKLIVRDALAACIKENKNTTG